MLGSSTIEEKLRRHTCSSFQRRRRVCLQPFLKMNTLAVVVVHSPQIAECIIRSQLSYPGVVGPQGKATNYIEIAGSGYKRMCVI